MEVAQQIKDNPGWTALLVVALPIVASLLTVLATRRWSNQDKAQDKRDKREDVRESNQASQLEADGVFRDSLINRVEKLETKLEAMQKEQLSQAITNERLSVENTHLRKDKERQEGEIADLKQRNRTLNDKVTELTGVVHRLEIRISELTGQPIDVRLVEEQKP